MYVLPLVLVWWTLCPGWPPWPPKSVFCVPVDSMKPASTPGTFVPQSLAKLQTGLRLITSGQCDWPSRLIKVMEKKFKMHINLQVCQVFSDFYCESPERGGEILPVCENSYQRRSACAACGRVRFRRRPALKLTAHCNQRMAADSRV